MGLLEIHFFSDDDEHEQSARDILNGTKHSKTEARLQTLQPNNPIQGTSPQSRSTSSLLNKEPEVGNIGIYGGNWGLRLLKLKDKNQRARCYAMDEQTLKNQANVLMLAEAREEVETLLKSGPIAGASSGTKLEQRSTHQYFVVRGEEQSSVLCAARTDTTTKLELKDFRVSKDFTDTEKKTTP